MSQGTIEATGAPAYGDPVRISIRKADDGRCRAVFDAPAAPQVEAPTLEALLDALKPVLAVEVPGPLTDREREQQDADDLAAARDGLEEIRRGESVPWEQVKAELGL